MPCSRRGRPRTGALKSIGALRWRDADVPQDSPVQYRAGMFMQRQSVIARWVPVRQTPVRSLKALSARSVGLRAFW